MLIALSKCVSNIYYSAETRRNLLRSKLETNKFYSNKSRDNSFIETISNIKFSSEVEEKTEKNEAGVREKAEAVTNSEAVSGNESERRSSKKKTKAEAKTKSMAAALKTAFKSHRKSKSKSKTKVKAKFIPIIFIAILVTAFIAKTIFTIVENHYKKKLYNLLKNQSEEISKQVDHMIQNEIQSCTITTLMLATNKEIIMLYKLRLVYVKAYMLNFKESDCQTYNCDQFTTISEKEKCLNEKDRCFSFTEVKDKFAAMHQKVDAGIEVNLKFLKVIRSNACNQRLFYHNLQQELQKLEKKVEDLQDELGLNVVDTGMGIIKTILNSVLFSLWEDKSFTSVSYTRENNNLIVNDINMYKVSRMIFLERPIITTSNLKEEINRFKHSFKTKTAGNEELTEKQKKEYEKKYGKLEKNCETLGKVMEKNFPKKDTDKIVATIDELPEVSGLSEKEKENVEIKEENISDEKLKRHLTNLKFARTCIDYIRMIFAFIQIFDIAVGGLSLFSLIEAILEIIVRILGVAIAHVDYSMLDVNAIDKKTKEYKAKRRAVIDAYAQLSFSIIYLTFFPASVIIKGTYDAILKFVDMVNAIKKYKQQEIEGSYYIQLAKTKSKHSDLFRTYSVCEAKFYGNLNILNIVNTIIKDEIDIIKNENLESYNKFINSLISNPHSREFIKNNIKELCNENIQFCSHSISEEFLTNYLDFSHDEMKQLKKQAIYGPYSDFGIAKTAEEFKSFMNLGYEPIGATNYFRTTYAFTYNEKEKEIIKNIEEGNYMLMGCRMCSKRSVIRHFEIFEDEEIKNPNPFKKFKERNPNFSGSCNETDVKQMICKCIYNDSQCLTYEINSLRVNSQITILYEKILKYPEFPPNNGGKRRTNEKATYPGLDRIMFWFQTMGMTTNENKTQNRLFYLKINVGMWDSENKNWKEFDSQGPNSLYVSNKVTQNLSSHENLLLVNGNDCKEVKNGYPIIGHNYSKNDNGVDITNPTEKMCYKYLYLLNSNQNYLNNDNIEKIATYNNPYEYNFTFYNSADMLYLYYYSSNFKPDFIEDEDFKKETLPGWATYISFPPFKPISMDFSQFVNKYKKECESVCLENSSNPSACPSDKLNYNYISNKSIFNTINETNQNDYNNLLSDETLSTDQFPFYKDHSYREYNLLNNFNQQIIDLSSHIDISNGIDQEIKANYNIFKININLDSNPPINIMKHLKFEKGVNEKLTVNYQPTINQSTISSPNIVILDISQIVNLIYIVITIDELNDEADKRKLTENGYIMMRFEEKFKYKNFKMIHISEQADYFVYLFIKPLPSMGFIPLTTFGKVKCISAYLNNFKGYLSDDHHIFEIPAQFYHTKIFDIKTGFLLNYYTMSKSISLSHPGDITYDLKDLFNFDTELGNLIFTNLECKEDNFSFSIPIRFHKHPHGENNTNYRHLSIDQDDKITESYKITGPNINEIYWLQFKKINKINQGRDQEEMDLGDKMGYFQLHSFETDYTSIYLQNQTSYGNKWKNLKQSDKIMHVKVWIAYDYRHGYNQEELCNKCKDTETLLSEYDKFIKGSDSSNVPTPISTGKFNSSTFALEGVNLYPYKPKLVNSELVPWRNSRLITQSPQCQNDICNFALFLNKFRNNPKEILELGPWSANTNYILSKYIQETGGNYFRKVVLSRDPLFTYITKDKNIKNETIKSLTNFHFNRKNYQIVSWITRDLTIENTSNILPFIDDLFSSGDSSFYLNFFERNDLMMYAFGRAYPAQEGENKYLFSIFLYKIKSKDEIDSSSPCDSEISEDLDDEEINGDEFIQLTHGFRDGDEINPNESFSKLSLVHSYDKTADVSPLLQNLRKTPSKYKKYLSGLQNFDNYCNNFSRFEKYNVDDASKSDITNEIRKYTKKYENIPESGYFKHLKGTIQDSEDVHVLDFLEEIENKFEVQVLGFGVYSLNIPNIYNKDSFFSTLNDDLQTIVDYLFYKNAGVVSVLRQFSRDKNIHFLLFYLEK